MSLVSLVPHSFIDQYVSLTWSASYGIYHALRGLRCPLPTRYHSVFWHLSWYSRIPKNCNGVQIFLKL